MLSKILIAVILFIFGIKIFIKAGLQKYKSIFSMLISLVLLTLFSEKLTVFYILYIIFTYAVLLLIQKLHKTKKLFFVLMCVVFISPFIIWRTVALPEVISSVMLVGFAYNMLKAVDALFYVYYTDIKIPFIEYANYILFFPVFTAGPIFRYRDFSKQFADLQAVNIDDINCGVKRFIKGLFKKVVLLTVLAMLFDKLAQIEEYHCYTSLAIICLAYIVLYIDFSAYSDMAIGVGKIIGVTIPENFKKPWTSPSFTQFWRRWHVTLSDWIREHIFVVVQGKQLNKYQSALIGMTTMIVMSLWHNFTVLAVVSGIYMGFFLVIENIFSLSTFNVRKEKKYKYIIRCICVNFFFAINALAFSLDMEKIICILKGIFH